MTIHGMYRRPEYHVWVAMRARCRNHNTVNYKRYGGRGIRVCKRWERFACFYADMGPRPSSMHSIERSDNDGNYCKRNCHWATHAEQELNKHNLIFFTCNGRTQSLAEWAQEMGIAYGTVYRRIRRGWPVGQALLTPTGGPRFQPRNSPADQFTPKNTLPRILKDLQQSPLRQSEPGNRQSVSERSKLKRGRRSPQEYQL